MAIATFN